MFWSRVEQLDFLMFQTPCRKALAFKNRNFFIDNSKLKISCQYYQEAELGIQSLYRFSHFQWPVGKIEIIAFKCMKVYRIVTWKSINQII
jgi:hypothetical protein